MLPAQQFRWNKDGSKKMVSWLFCSFSILVSPAYNLGLGAAIHQQFTAIMADEVVILDGSMGSELARRGYVAKVSGTWSAYASWYYPKEVLKLHKDYINCGVDAIITNTYSCNSYVSNLLKVLLQDIIHKSIASAYKAIDETKNLKNSKKIMIGGSIAPLKDTFRPDLVPDIETLRNVLFVFFFVCTFFSSFV